MRGNDQKEDGTHIPRPTLGIFDVMMLIIGIVIGARIFRSPQVIALNSPNEYFFFRYIWATWKPAGQISVDGKSVLLWIVPKKESR